MKRFAIIADIEIYKEDFMDEDTEEIVSIERTNILSYNLEDFNLSKNKIEAEKEVIKIVNNFNNTLKPGEKLRKFIKFISKKQQKKIEDSKYDQKIIKRMVK